MSLLQLRFEKFLVCDVNDQAFHHGMAVAATDNNGGVAHPDDAAVFTNHAVLGLKVFAAEAGVFSGLDDCMIFGRNVVNPILGSGEPLVGSIAKDRFDLRADVKPLAIDTNLGDVTDSGYLFDECGNLFSASSRAFS